MRVDDLPAKGDTIEHKGLARTVSLVKVYTRTVPRDAPGLPFADIYFESHPLSGQRSIRVDLDPDETSP